MSHKVYIYQVIDDDKPEPKPVLFELVGSNPRNLKIRLKTDTD